jgi:hypothetical protein
MSVRVLAVGGPVVHAHDDSVSRQVGRLRRHDPDFGEAAVERADEKALSAAYLSDRFCIRK